MAGFESRIVECINLLMVMKKFIGLLSQFSLWPL